LPPTKRMLTKTGKRVLFDIESFNKITNLWNNYLGLNLALLTAPAQMAFLLRYETTTLV
jgi:hypothetical protein